MLGHRTLNVEDYVAIFKRRWLLILLPTLLLPLVAYLITFTIEPQYLSQTLVLIEQQKIPTDYVRPVINEDLDNRLASMREQILSRTSLQPIIEKYSLYANKGLAMEDRIDKARKAIDIKAIHSEIAQTNGLPGFFISFKASDPHTAQSVCSDITGLFVQQSLTSHAATVEQTTDFLTSQLNAAKRDLDDKDQKLAAFKMQHFGKLPDDQTSNVNLLASLNTQLGATTQQLQTLEQNKSMADSMLASQSQANPAATVANRTAQAHDKEMQDLIAQEADLTTHYTAENPDVKAIHRKIADLQKVMDKEAAAPPPPAPVQTAATPHLDSAGVQQLRAQLNGINMAIQSTRKQQADLEAQVRNYQGRIQSTPQVEEDYKQLTRDYGQSSEQYQSLLAKFNQSKMATDLEKRQQGEQFRVMDEANLPDSPTYPKKGLFAVGGLLIGLALGMLITALLEYKDTAVRSERDIWAFTQLPTLAVIAWSGEVAHVKLSRAQRIKRFFLPRRHKDLLLDVKS